MNSFEKFAQGELEKARKALGDGTDDDRWRPGETAVDALIRERDEALARLHQLTWCACCGDRITPKTLNAQGVRHLPDSVICGQCEFVNSEDDAV